MTYFMMPWSTGRLLLVPRRLLWPRRREPKSANSHSPGGPGFPPTNSTHPFPPPFSSPLSCKIYPAITHLFIHFNCLCRKEKASVWNVLKNNLGKSLSKIALPLVFNEPLSFLQRCAEDLEYSDILDAAAKLTDSAVRDLASLFLFFYPHHLLLLNPHSPSNRNVLPMSESFR